jgi:hypothetical protein
MIYYQLITMLISLASVAISADNIHNENWTVENYLITNYCFQP